jgi:hypothetical protein
MMNPRLLFPLLCLLLAACSSGEVRLPFQPIQVKSLSIGESFRDPYAVATFESFNVCDSNKFSEADVHEFFEKARVISYDEMKRLESEGKISACQMDGSIELKDGRDAYWNINRARTGFLAFGLPDTGVAWLYCDTCDSKGNYSMQPGEPEKLRPILQSVIIEENALALEDKNTDPELLEQCQDFILTENDILEFFQIARPASVREYLHELEWSRCRVLGTAILSNGEKVWWNIDRFRGGALGLADMKTVLYFFCEECRSARYYEHCDKDCVDAIERGEEDSDTPDPETGD